MFHIAMLLLSIWRYYNVYSANVGLKSELNILSHEKSEVYRADSVFLQRKKVVLGLAAASLRQIGALIPYGDGHYTSLSCQEFLPSGPLPCL